MGWWKWEGGGFTWGGVEGWGEKAYNCNCITIKKKKKKEKKMIDLYVLTQTFKRYCY